MFLFLGHVNDPESVLFACDSLAKPTRESNPWGRDILEAMAMGKPVISIGTYDSFVKDGRTGFLLKHYDSEKFADRITELACSPDRVMQMAKYAQKIVSEKCNGHECTNDIFWG